MGFLINLWHSKIIQLELSGSQQSPMIFLIGSTFIILLVGLKILQITSLNFLKSKKMSLILDLTNIDKFIRIIQYFAMFIAGHNYLHPLQSHGFVEQMIIKFFNENLIEAAHLRNFARNTRKIFRFIRGPKFIKGIFTKNPNKICFVKNNNKQNILQIKKYGQSVLKKVAYFCIVIFYLTDHHQSLNIIKLMFSDEDISEQIGDFGLIMRTLYSIIIIVITITDCIQKYLQNPTMKRNLLRKLVCSSLLQILGQTADSFLFYGLVYRDFMSNKNLGLLGFIASILRLHKLILD